MRVESRKLTESVFKATQLGIEQDATSRGSENEPAGTVLKRFLKTVMKMLIAIIFQFL